MAEVTPPPLLGPTAKERKYDRQLRLWAASGQTALEDAHVLLFNSGSGVAGIESLKNLILPGIGNFTIQDPAVVTEADLGANFFLTEEDLGCFRSERCCKLLQELNPDVHGHFISEPLESFISRPNVLSPYTLILVTLPVKPEILEIISNHAQKFSIPTFYIHCIGFYSHFTLQLPSAFPIVDTHPDPASTTDLRLLEPWDELLDLMRKATHDIDHIDDETHGHIPYVLVLLHHLEQWKVGHKGKTPQNYKEKSEFRDDVRRAMRSNNSEGGEENFEEAAGAVLKSLNASFPSRAVREVFAAEECSELTKESDDFWVVAHAIRDFYHKNSVLPVSGSVPDMKAKSADYIELQNVYKAKARKDFQEVMQRVVDLVRDLDRPVMVDPKMVEAFCKSSGYIKLVRGREPHIAKAQNPVSWKGRSRSVVANSLKDPNSLILLYIAFLAYDSYAASHGMEGQVGAESSASDETLDVQLDKLKGIAFKFMDDLITEAGSFLKNLEYSETRAALANIVEEIVRARGGELHNIAAATGGMVAQEVIKVITRQYIPIDNTCLFDGILSQTSVLRL